MGGRRACRWACGGRRWGVLVDLPAGKDDHAHGDGAFPDCGAEGDRVPSSCRRPARSGMRAATVNHYGNNATGQDACYQPEGLRGQADSPLDCILPALVFVQAAAGVDGRIRGHNAGRGSAHGRAIVRIKRSIREGGAGTGRGGRFQRGAYGRGYG